MLLQLALDCGEELLLITRRDLLFINDIELFFLLLLSLFDLERVLLEMVFKRVDWLALCVKEDLVLALERPILSDLLQLVFAHLQGGFDHLGFLHFALLTLDLSLSLLGCEKVAFPI